MPIVLTAVIEAEADTRAMARAVGWLAEQALTRELELTPKPGLVDRANSGAHGDMDIHTMRASIAAIAPWFPLFFARGVEGCAIAAAALLARIRVDGMACEQAMFDATGGVNTHKGAVFSLGLLCAAAGRLHGRGETLRCDALCAEAAYMGDDLVQRELIGSRAAQTAGERLYCAHGLTGVRGEAQSGFAMARQYGVAAYRAARLRGAAEEPALLEALISLMVHNDDTNVVARGGLAGLTFVQSEARRARADPWPSTRARIGNMRRLDRALTERNLSPGGSADLLAVSWFLANLGALAHAPEDRISCHDTTHLRPERSGAARGGIPLRLRVGAWTLQQRLGALAVDLGARASHLEAHRPAQLG